MSLKIRDAKPKIPPVSPGTHIGVCVGVIDVGTQSSEKFKSTAPKIRIVWELSGQTVTVDGKQEPRILSREYTNTASAKGALRAMMSSWNGVQYTDETFQGYLVREQIGKPAMLNVVLNETGEYANISAVIPVPAGMTVPPAVTPPIVWDMDEWTDEGFAALPEWVRNRIMQSEEYKRDHLPESVIDFPTNGVYTQSSIPTQTVSTPTPAAPVSAAPPYQPQPVGVAAPVQAAPVARSGGVPF